MHTSESKPETLRQRSVFGQRNAQLLAHDAQEDDPTGFTMDRQVLTPANLGVVWVDGTEEPPVLRIDLLRYVNRRRSTFDPHGVTSIAEPLLYSREGNGGRLVGIKGDAAVLSTLRLTITHPPLPAAANTPHPPRHLPGL